MLTMFALAAAAVINNPFAIFRRCLPAYREALADTALTPAGGAI